MICSVEMTDSVSKDLIDFQHFLNVAATSPTSSSTTRIYTDAKQNIKYTGKHSSIK